MVDGSLSLQGMLCEFSIACDSNLLATVNVKRDLTARRACSATSRKVTSRAKVYMEIRKADLSTRYRTLRWEIFHLGSHLCVLPGFRWSRSLDSAL